ncbi:hypothetical protein [Rhizobium sp. CRRU65]|uniref:hypothetical protein n=1 Tax=Rhizobium sp. CRRU65 TaxID=3399566 RepID=UPI003AF8DAA8
MSEMYLALQAAKLSNHRRAGNTMRQIASPDRLEASWHLESRQGGGQGSRLKRACETDGWPKIEDDIGAAASTFQIGGVGTFEPTGYVALVSSLFMSRTGIPFSWIGLATLFGWVVWMSG